MARCAGSWPRRTRSATARSTDTSQVSLSAQPVSHKVCVQVNSWLGWLPLSVSVPCEATLAICACWWKICSGGIDRYVAGWAARSAYMPCLVGTR